MGFYKTQKGRIEAVSTGGPEEPDLPPNGHNKVLMCEHELPVNACNQCREEDTPPPKDQ